MAITKSIYIFIGPPGAGKGSLSQLCQDRLGWSQLSTGVLCRSHIDRQTEIGKKIDFAIKSGKLVDDALICNMVHEWLLEHSIALEKGLILDGFPRTVAQAQALREFIEDKLSDCQVNIVQLRISDQGVIQRLAGRIVCKNRDCQRVYSRNCDTVDESQKLDACVKCSSALIRRADDEKATIEKRLKTYYEHEGDLLNFFARSGLLVRSVDVDVALERVFKTFKEVVEANG